MKKTIYALFFLLPTIVFGQKETDKRLETARIKAMNYYENMAQVNLNPQGEAAINSTNESLAMFGKDQDKQTNTAVANEFYKIMGEGSGPCVDVLTYWNKFRQLSKEGLKFEYTVQNVEYMPAITIEKKELDTTFVSVRVKKSYIWKDHQYNYTDEFYLNTKEWRVISINNEVYPSTDIVIDTSLPPSMICRLATILYANKEYDRAYQVFLTALKKDPRNETAAYNLGVMVFRGHGCKQYSRRVRDYLAVFYLMKGGRDARYWLRSQSIITFDEHEEHYFNPIGENDVNPFPANRLLSYNSGKHRFGYISAHGAVIPFQYKKAYPFGNNGTAIVLTQNNQWIEIDTLGHVINTYDFVNEAFSYDFGWDRQLLGEARLYITGNQGKGIYNRINGNWILPMKYDEIFDVMSTIGGYLVAYKVKKNGKYGIARLNGEIVLPCEFDNIIVDYSDGKKIRLITNYSEVSLNKLRKQYEKDYYSQALRIGYYGIPYEELKKIGTPLIINLNTF